MRKKSQKTTNPAGGDFLSGNLNYLDEVKDVKITKRRRSLKPVLVMLLMVTGLAGGVIMVMIDAANRPVEEVATDELESNTIDAQTRLNINLGASGESRTLISSLENLHTNRCTTLAKLPWGGISELNRRPSGPQSDALTN